MGVCGALFLGPYRANALALRGRGAHARRATVVACGVQRSECQ